MSIYDSVGSLIAVGFACLETLSVEVDGQAISWQEHRLVVRSLQQAKAARTALLRRLEAAEAALLKLNERGRGKQRFTERASLAQRVEAITKRHL